MRLLLIEDDPRLGELIKNYLTSELEEVDIANNGAKIKDRLEEKTYDVLILDLMLPHKNGIDICRELRQYNQEIPILLITALNNKNDKVKAFEAGADDFLTKPFDFQELLLRLRALVRRDKKEKVSSLSWENLTLYQEEKTVFYKEQMLSLTPTEYNILYIFLKQPLIIHSQENIINQLWVTEDIPTYSTLRSHIKSLRNKLKAVGLNKDFIETVYGMGYRLKKIKQNSIVEKTIKETIKENENTELINQSELKLTQMIEQMWITNQGSIKNDCEILLDYVMGKSCDIDNSESIRISHNLTGFLGSIGFSSASDIARKIENLLKLNSLEKYQEEIKNLIDELIHNLFSKNHLSPSVTIPIESNNTLPNRQIKILVIDEDQKLANQFILTVDNPQVIFKFAHSIPSTINYLNAESFDLIILETEWNNQENQDILLTLNNYLVNYLNVVVYTKNDNVSNRLRCSNYGISAFISKGNSIESLWRDVEKIICRNFAIKSNDNINTILLIDDDARYLEFLTKKLNYHQVPAKVESISNSEVFLDTIKKLKPALIILDLEMPQINGLYICRIIKTDPNFMSIPIIFLTANYEQKTITKFVEAGANDFINKSQIDIELYPRIINYLK